MPHRHVPEEDGPLSRVEQDGTVEALELVGLGHAVLQRVADALADRFGHQDLARSGDALRTGGGVDHRADGREVAMRAAELAEAQLTAMDADADAEIDAGLLLAGNAAPLDLSRRQQRLPRMVFLLDR